MPQTYRGCGQIAIRPSDFAYIPWVLDAPDTIAYLGKNRLGLDAIQYSRRGPNNEIYYLEEVRTGRRKVALASFWIRK